MFFNKLFIILIFQVLAFTAITFGQSSVKMGKVSNASIQEISGIVPYTYQRGYFWVHNDSGDGAYIYLIDSLCNIKSRVHLKGINVVDCEDIARIEVEGVHYLILGDIGNNIRDREILSFYIIEEPKMNLSEKELAVDVFKRIDFKYQDKRRDTEAFFVDPITKELFLISKRDFESTVFSFKLDFGIKETQILNPILTLPFTFTTTSDISPDGKYLVIKNLTNVYLWERPDNKSIIQTLKGKPLKIPYIIEPQGEAICFDLIERHIYTISERPFGLDSYLYKYNY